MEEVYYVKSLEEDFISKTLKGKKKIDFQSVDNMVKNKVIKPNTRSFGKEPRLACTILHKNYLKTYRPQGIIFKTTQKPDYIAPFDLVLLTNTGKIITQYYRIKNNLHLYYGQSLIDGFEKFVFNSFNDMIKKYSSPEEAWSGVNSFRRLAGFKYLPKQKYRLVEYNEAIFHKPVKIKPIAIFGYRKNSREIAKKLGLPHYISAKEFYRKKLF